MTERPHATLTCLEAQRLRRQREPLLVHERQAIGETLPHGNHLVLPAKDPRSRVNRQNVPQTCGMCHVGLSETYNQSIHGEKLAAGTADLWDSGRVAGGSTTQITWNGKPLGGPCYGPPIGRWLTMADRATQTCRFSPVGRKGQSPEAGENGRCPKVHP